MPSCDPQRSVRMLWYVANRCFDVSVFEKLRFHPSTRQHENGVFKKIHSGQRFRKASFSVTENAVSVWTPTQTDKKRCVFKNIRIRVDGALINVSDHFSVICKHEIIVKLNFPIFLVLVRQRGKSQKYFNLLSFEYDLNHSNL